ncbi:hypothetical protein ACOTCJ_11720 [Achromobacter xylosoxidans]|uniref:Uncharacterized protein n=1 Tax=Achromobacter denitrificans TaxID=32002 RepID=A0ABZ3GCE1_ACHDE|nr:hypothetical protein [Achromobacter xylosoxidans]MDX3877628.1 hypothetical protein [Achromobacter sp.]
MANYFVTYDLSNADQDRYDQLQAAIEQLGFTVHLQYSVFYLRSPFLLEQINDNLLQHIRDGERLLVIQAQAAVGGGHGQDWNQVLRAWEQ